MARARAGSQQIAYMHVARAEYMLYLPRLFLYILDFSFAYAYRGSTRRRSQQERLSQAALPPLSLRPESLPTGPGS